jgi:hypothetical protein
MLGRWLAAGGALLALREVKSELAAPATEALRKSLRSTMFCENDS